MKLQELKNIIIKYYAPTEQAELLNNVLFDIFTCETDLRIHCQVEDDIFVPAVEILEEKVGVQQNDAPAEEEEKRPEDTLSERERELCIVWCAACQTNRLPSNSLFRSTRC